MMMLETHNPSRCWLNNETVPEELLEKYSRWLERQLWLSGSTRSEYLARARQFIKFCKRASIEAGDLTRQFLNYLRGKRISERRIKSFIAVVEQLQALSYADDPSKSMDVEPNLSIDDSNRLLEAARKSLFKRDYAIMCLILRAGLSLKECRFLMIGELRNAPIACVHRYGRSRMVVLDEETWTAIKDWLGCPMRYASKSEYIFPSQCSRPLSRTALDNQVRRIGISVGMVVTPQMVQRAGIKHCGTSTYSPEFFAPPTGSLPAQMQMPPT